MRRLWITGINEIQQASKRQHKGGSEVDDLLNDCPEVKDEMTGKQQRQGRFLSQTERRKHVMSRCVAIAALTLAVAIQSPRNSDAQVYMSSSGDPLSVPELFFPGMFGDSTQSLLDFGGFADVLVYYGYIEYGPYFEPALAAIDKTVLFEHVALPQSLDFCTVYLFLPATSFTAEETQRLHEYVTNGGIIVAVGEHSGFSFNHRPRPEGVVSGRPPEGAVD
jgi:hypothetical protein